MTILADRVSEASEAYAANRAAMMAQLAKHDEQLAIANAGGGPRYVERHRQRGKLLARERVEAMLDQDSPFLELSPLAAYGTDFPVGGGLVTGIGVVEGVECLLIANALTMINLVESGGADLPTQSEIFIPGGQTFHDITDMSARGIPTIAVVFGNSTAGGAYLPGMSDYVVMI